LVVPRSIPTARAIFDTPLILGIATFGPIFIYIDACLLNMQLFLAW
jgi:hypothetical protein